MTRVIALTAALLATSWCTGWFVEHRHRAVECPAPERPAPCHEAAVILRAADSPANCIYDGGRIHTQTLPSGDVLATCTCPAD